VDEGDYENIDEENVEDDNIKRTRKGERWVLPEVKMERSQDRI
jgi:hypothetical protein